MARLLARLVLRAETAPFEVEVVRGALEDKRPAAHSRGRWRGPADGERRLEFNNAAACRNGTIIFPALLLAVWRESPHVGAALRQAGGVGVVGLLGAARTTQPPPPLCCRANAMPSRISPIRTEGKNGVGGG